MTHARSHGTLSARIGFERLEPCFRLHREEFIRHRDVSSGSASERVITDGSALASGWASSKSCAKGDADQLMGRLLRKFAPLPASARNDELH